MNHTLVIPTYNRPALLKRLVQYYYKRAWPINLLVLDSSKPEIAQENATMLSTYGEPARHVVFPQNLPMAFKVAQGLALVQTAYASCCADDDIVFVDGLREAIAFLDNHQDYVCAHGLYLNFRQANHDIHLMLEYAGPGNEASHPGARIFRLCQQYESLFYATFRTQDLRDIFSTVAALPTLHYQELMQSVGALIKGKVSRFPRLYAARQSCDPAEPGRDKWQTYYWFADNPAEFLDHYQVYRGDVWKFYEAHALPPRLDKQALFKALDLAHAVYFSAGCPPEYFHSVLQPYWPEDPYLKIDLKDLLGRVKVPAIDAPAAKSPALRQEWTAARILIGSLYAWARIRGAPGLARLNRAAAKAFRNPWKCHLPVNLRRLAVVPNFRKTYFELCHYLDQS